MKRNNNQQKTITVQEIILLISVFICGACVMIMELVGSRILAPYFGTSIIIWTSIIGVILGAMSIGYLLGGRLADKKADYANYSLIIAISSVCVAILSVIKNPLIMTIQSWQLSTEVSGLLAALVLFALPSIILAMISPYAMKLSIVSLASSGRTSGKIYAISTLGSIVGTFLAGFYLIPRFGNTHILLGISATLIILACFMRVQKTSKLKVLMIIAILVLAYCNYDLESKNNTIKYETQYGTITIGEDSTVRWMQINETINSIMYLNSEQLAYDYTKYYDLSLFFNPDLEHALAIGGAGYSYPTYYLNKYPEKKIDVVEIDPKVTQLARKYFRLVDNPRLKIFHEDGRTYLNKNIIKYDVILGDAYVVEAPPYHLVTKETMLAIHRSLTDTGFFASLLVSANINTPYFNAYYNTLASVFPYVLTFRTDAGYFILYALKTPPPELTSDDKYLQFLLDHYHPVTPQKSIIFTDEYSPVEYLTQIKRKETSI